MDSEYDASRIEQTKRKLYSPEEKTGTEPFSRLSPNKIDLPSDWGDHISERTFLRRSQGIRILKWTVGIAVLAMLGSIGYLLYSLYDPFAKPSDKNITFSLDFPVSLSSGSTADLKLTVANANKTPLEYANLTVFYPQGTKAGDDSQRDFLKDQKDLGGVKAQSSAEYNSRLLILGEENKDKEIRVVLEYRFQGINSVFTKEEKWPVRMLSSPLNVTVKTLKEVNAGQPVELEITVLSNALTPLHNILLKAEYPQSFTLEDANPKPTFGLNAWKLGDIDPAEKITIRLRGKITGEDTEEKAFRTTVGETSAREERNVSTVYATTLSTMTVKKPFIGIELLFNKKPVGDTISAFGQIIEGGIAWTNNLPTTIAGAEIEVHLRGTALDRFSVTPQEGGFYRSIDDTIIWDERGHQDLALLEAKQSGIVSFRFSPLPSVSGGKPLKNPTIIADVTVRGKRIGDSGAPEEVNSAITRTVKVASDVRFTAKPLYYGGPLINRGPIPPKVENETSYTIQWSITNTSNDLDGVEVRGILPSYVKWDGSVSPGTDNVVYDKNTNQVIWRVGSVPAGTGVTSQPRDLYFQVVLLPSVSQIGRSPVLVTNSSLSGRDLYTDMTLERSVPEVTTSLLQSDPKAPRGSEWVVE